MKREENIFLSQLQYFSSSSFSDFPKWNKIPIALIIIYTANQSSTKPFISFHIIFFFFYFYYVNLFFVSTISINFHSNTNQKYIIHKRIELNKYKVWIYINTQLYEMFVWKWWHQAHSFFFYVANQMIFFRLMLLGLLKKRVAEVKGSMSFGDNLDMETFVIFERIWDCKFSAVSLDRIDLRDSLRHRYKEIVDLFYLFYTLNLSQWQYQPFVIQISVYSNFWIKLCHFDLVT